MNKEKLINFISKRPTSIRGEIAACIALVVAVPLILLGLIMSRPLYGMVVASTVRDEQNSLSRIVPQVNDQVAEIVSCMDQITEEPFYRELFYEEIDRSPEELTESEEARHFAAKVSQIVKDSPVNAVKIYIESDDQEIFAGASPLSDIIRPGKEIKATYWHGIFNGTSYPVLHCPSFYLSSKEIADLGNCAYIIRTNAYYKGKVYPAYAALYYSNDVYARILSETATTNGSVSYIINDRDSLVVTTDKALSGTYRIRYDSIKESLLASNSFVEREVAGNAVYVAFFQIENADWFMVNVIPREPVQAIANGMMYRIIAIFLACFLFAVLVALAVSESITRRIAALSMQMNKVHDGPPVPMEESTVRDEVGELISTYNYMTREMNSLIQKQEETAQELRYAEFNALQAQINPHFLYNTMDMINWMALQGRNREVSEVVQKLSRFYKLTLSRKKDYSTIADELEHARVYIELQNMRFGDAIDFVIDVPDELCECRLPKLTFQPILENAILHGILEKESKTGTIVLTVWAQEEDIHILVSDDGVGMEESVRSQILSEERIRPNNSRGANVAVVNIHRRLQLLYGEKYGLSYSSTPGQGTDVTILIPKHVGPDPYVKQDQQTRILM